MHLQFEKSEKNREITDYIENKQGRVDSFCYLCPQDGNGITKELERLFAKTSPGYWSSEMMWGCSKVCLTC